MSEIKTVATRYSVFRDVDETFANTFAMCIEGDGHFILLTDPYRPEHILLRLHIDELVAVAGAAKKLVKELVKEIEESIGKQCQ